jgi:hypothetical protein
MLKKTQTVSRPRNESEAGVRALVGQPTSQDRRRPRKPQRQLLRAYGTHQTRWKLCNSCWHSIFALPYLTQTEKFLTNKDLQAHAQDIRLTIGKDWLRSCRAKDRMCHKPLFLRQQSSLMPKHGWRSTLRSTSKRNRQTKSPVQAPRPVKLSPARTLVANHELGFGPEHWAVQRASNARATFSSLCVSAEYYVGRSEVRLASEL